MEITLLKYTKEIADQVGQQSIIDSLVNEFTSEGVKVKDIDYFDWDDADHIIEFPTNDQPLIEECYLTNIGVIRIKHEQI